jgi:sporulation protein YlmC with PRC-barrel domain
MKKSRILVLIGVFALNLAFAQDYTFKVMANKGTNEVKSGDAWQSVKTGDRLKSGDELKISENSYVALVHATGKPVEIRQSGNYKVNDLASKVGAGASVLNKYTDFILSSNSAEAKKNRLSATGAVHRGLSDIKVFLPENQYSDIFNKNLIVNWESVKGVGPYVVIVKNMFDEELVKLETPENFVVIDRTDPKLANDEALLIEVKSKADAKSKSEQHLVKKLSVARQESVKKMIDEMGSDMKEETALNKFILAGFYEENKLFIDAITAYEQAIKLAPDVPTYQEAYEEFLLRNKLKNPK